MAATPVSPCLLPSLNRDWGEAGKAYQLGGSRPVGRVLSACGHYIPWGRPWWVQVLEDGSKAVHISGTAIGLARCHFLRSVQNLQPTF